jgi:drug/metabolite transporter (DMT)-like permease
MSGSALGITLTVAGVVVCAIYTVATRRWLLGSDSTFGIVLAQQLHALALATVVVLALGVGGQTVLPTGLTMGGIASAIASGLLYYGLAYSFYISALRHVPASVAAVSFYLIPVFGIAAAWIYGERLEPTQWLGAMLVVGAVAVVSIRAARPVAGTLERGGDRVSVDSAA